MKVQLEEISPIKKTLTVEVEADQIKKEWESVVKSFNKKVKLKGFRPGKIPVNVLIKYYGPQIEEEVVSRTVNRSYPEALKESGVVPVAYPELDYPTFDKEVPFIYKAMIETKPDIPVADYKGMEVKKAAVKVMEEDIQKRLMAIQMSHGELLPLKEERPLQNGDFAVLDYQSFMDGNAVPGGAANNYDLEIGAGYFNPEVEKVLVGLEKGQEKDFDIDFPEDYGNTSLKGKRVHYQVKVQDIKERHLPELNDAFAQGLSKDLTSLEDLKKKIREDLEAEAHNKADGKLREDLIDGLIAKTEFEIPETLVNQEIQQMMMRIQQDLSRQGLSWEKAGLDPSGFMDRFRPSAQKLVRKTLLLEKIAQLESLTVTPEEIEAEFNRIALQVNQSPTIVKEIYHKNNMTEQMNLHLLEEKTINFLKEHAAIQTE
jgi:trigger factor